MSDCLSDARVQAVADGEATAGEIDHASRCATCRTRVDEVRQAVSAFAQELGGMTVPPLLGARVNAAVARSAAGRSGATTLRATPRRRPVWLVAGSAGAAAAVIAIVFVLLPSFDPGTRLSASEILNRSLQTLVVDGTERLRYELTVQAPSSASAESGTFQIEQLIDHRTGRWRFARFTPDGGVLNGIAENPAASAREALMTLDGQTYRFYFDIEADQRVPLWDLQRRYAESMIRVVQASGAEVVTTEQGPDGERYVVDLPSADRPDRHAPFDLDRARVVVDATDFHVIEFHAAGLVMGEQVAIGYRLLTRDLLGGTLPDADFTFGPRGSGAIELQGHGTREVPHDFLSLLLREVSRSQR